MATDAVKQQNFDSALMTLENLAHVKMEPCDKDSVSNNLDEIIVVSVPDMNNRESADKGAGRDGDGVVTRTLEQADQSSVSEDTTSRLHREDAGQSPTCSPHILGQQVRPSASEKTGVEEISASEITELVEAVTASEPEAETSLTTDSKVNKGVIEPASEPSQFSAELKSQVREGLQFRPSKPHWSPGSGETTEKLPQKESLEAVEPQSNLDEEATVEDPQRSASDSIAIGQLVDNLLQRSPSVASALMLIVSPQADEHVADTTFSVAKAFADRGLGKILLVDADLENRKLTHQLEQGDSDGVINLVNGEHDLVSLDKIVVSSEVEDLDFLPVGTGVLSRRKVSISKMAVISKKLKAEYSYVFLSGGSASGPLCQTWCSQTDSTYMLVSLGVTEMDQAKTAVAEMRSYGARLLGCIVAEPSA